MSRKLGDLDARRAERAAARAARNEGMGETLPIRFGGKVIATLQPEFPLRVLAPLGDIDLDIALLVQQVLANAAAEDAARANLELVVNLLAANPNLPSTFVAAVKEMGRRLLGKDGYQAFVEQDPTPWDVAALISDLLTWYGVSLGESLRSSISSTPDGETSNATSGSIGGSTPAASGGAPASPGSSASAA